MYNTLLQQPPSPMPLIVWLWNPWQKYTHTRHNIGFVLLEYLIWQTDRSFEKKHNADLYKASIYDKTQNTVWVLACKPQTFMNLSGHSVQSVSSFFDIPPEEILVIHDDIDLPLGDVRYKIWWWHGWHNWLRDISQKIWSDYHRIRIGVGRPDWPMNVSDYVLWSYNQEEKNLYLDARQDKGEDMIRIFLSS